MTQVNSELWVITSGHLSFSSFGDFRHIQMYMYGQILSGMSAQRENEENVFRNHTTIPVTVSEMYLFIRRAWLKYVSQRICLNIQIYNHLWIQITIK